MLFLYVVHYTTQHYSTINATQHSLKYSNTGLHCCDSPIKTTNGEIKNKKKHTPPCRRSSASVCHCALFLTPIFHPHATPRAPARGMRMEGKPPRMFPG